MGESDAAHGRRVGCSAVGPRREVVLAIGWWAACVVSSAVLLGWVWLAVGRGHFWRTDRRLGGHAPRVTGHGAWPVVTAVVPARNEARVLPLALPTLLAQDYPAPFHVVLVDDRSEDGTAAVARGVANESGWAQRLTVVGADPLPPGWAGKVWAMRRGVSAVRPDSTFVLFTDADIAHPADSVRALVGKALRDDLDLVSLMARLRAESAFERLLIPAFVYFFAMLYPFRWAGDPRRGTAAAAGGCMLVRRDALERAGGVESIAPEVIDDCALARRIKDHGRESGGRLWLGLSRQVRSVRAYGGLRGVWNTVARTAFTQLRYSPLLLLLTVLGMLLLFVAPPLAAVGGLLALVLGGAAPPAAWLFASGLGAWAIMAVTYRPMGVWYQRAVPHACTLPVAGALYTFMTISSAWRHLRGRGAAWQGRSYTDTRRTASRDRPAAGKDSE